MIVYLFQVKGLVAQLIKVKDVSTATALEVAAGNKVNIYNLKWLYIGGGGVGLRWRSGQSARLSPLRLRVRFSVIPSRTQCSTHVKRVSQHSAEGRGFSPPARFLPTGKLTEWVRINTDREVKSQLL